MTDDKRLIEDYLPIEAISAEASREKSVRKGHISTLHLWWALTSPELPLAGGERHLGRHSLKPLRNQNPAKHLDHAQKEVVAARYFDIPVAAVGQAASKLTRQ